MLNEGNVDAEEGAEFFRGEQFPLGAVGEDAAVFIRMTRSISGRMSARWWVTMRMPVPCCATWRRASRSSRWAARSRALEGSSRRSFGLVDKGAGDHDAALFAGGHFADEFGFEMGGLHELEGLGGPVAHFRRDMEIGPEGGGGEESGDDGVEPASDGVCARRGGSAETTPRWVRSWGDIPAFATEEKAELGGGV